MDVLGMRMRVAMVLGTHVEIRVMARWVIQLAAGISHLVREAYLVFKGELLVLAFDLELAWSRERDVLVRK